MPVSIRRWCYVVTFLVLILPFYAQPEPEGFAGSLEPPQDRQHSSASNGGDASSQLVNNQTESAGTNDSVHVVYSFTEDGEGKGEKELSSNQESNGKRPVHSDSTGEVGVDKAQQQLKAHPSVGKAQLVPEAEAEEGKLEEDEQVAGEAGSKENSIVRFVPDLPPSIIRPGHMLNGSWYILLHAVWCQYSQAAMTEFVLTIQHIVDHNISGIVVGKIDIIKHGDVAKHFRVKGTPTILFIRDGFRYTFDHPDITVANLVSFMMDILSFSISEVNTSAQLTALRKSHPVVFLMAHHEQVDKDWHSVYVRQAYDKCLKAKFSFTTKTEVVEEYNLDTLPAILVLKDETAVVFKDSLVPFALAKWILMEKDVAFPLVNNSNLRRYLQPVSGRRLAFLVVSENPAQRPTRETQAIKAVKKIAIGRKVHKRFQFCLLEGGSIPELLLRSSVRERPFFFVFEPYTGLYYMHQKQASISEDAVLKFLEDVVTRKEDALGGVTFLDQAIHLYQLGYAVIQSMIAHRPYLSIVTGLSMISVICFYFTIYCQRKSNKMSRKDMHSRRIAHSRRRKEELAKKEAEAVRRRIEAREGAVLRNRQRSAEKTDGRPDDTVRAPVESDDTQSGSDLEDSPSEHQHEN